MKLWLILSLLYVLTLCASGQENILSWATKADTYQEWLKQLERDTSKYRSLVTAPPFDLTVFIPTNEAFKNYKGPSVDLLGAHFILGAYDKDSLRKMESTKCFDQTRPKLRFTKDIGSDDKPITYVMDAKILESQQVGSSMVHIIDRVLNLPKASSRTAPLALDFINYHETYSTVKVNDGVQTFSAKINATNSSPLFDCLSCTFFVPESTKSQTERLLSRNVIAGHIIPNQAIFFRNMKNSTSYTTKADSSELSVSITKGARSADNSQAIYIHSTSKGSESSFRLGNTRVRVVQADIPVDNGVVHIIDRPLIIPDYTVLSYLTEESSASLRQFNDLLSNFASLRQYYGREDPSKLITVFAFSNEAYELVKNDVLLLGRKNRTALEELLKLHIVDGAVITSQNANTTKEKFSLANKKLHFSVAGDRLYVEGDGVKATSVYQDIVCTDGVIHVLNKILGIPSSPINDKLQEDPQFRTTYTVARKVQSDWLNRLGDKAKNFTFFAPSEAAWKKLYDKDPAAYKQLYNGLYPDNSMNILNRHLIENHAYSLDNLSSLSEVDTAASRLRIESKPGKKVTLKFMDVESGVSRPDIKATNGFIHEINTILMLEDDLKIDPSLARDSASLGRISPLAVLIAFAAFIIKLTFYQI